MTSIHQTAIVDKSAELAEGVTIGPYAIIGPQVQIGPGTAIGPHAHIECNTTVGRECTVCFGVVLGTDPQDLKFEGKETALVIGDHCTFREYCTVNRSTNVEMPTRIGNRVMMMAYSHVAHDCLLEDEVVMANCASLAGHIDVQKGAIIGGLSAAHQFTRIGKYAFIGGLSRIIMDVFPFSKASGHPAALHGINTIGLQRRAFSEERIRRIRQAYRIVFRKKLKLDDAVREIQETLQLDEDIEYILEFIGKSERGLMRQKG